MSELDEAVERAEKAEAELAAEREQRERLEKALRDQAHACGSWEEEQDRIEAAREVLRPAAPEPTHSCQPGNYPDCCDPTSEQPDLPLGHEFIQQSDLCAECAKPESAHRRK